MENNVFVALAWEYRRPDPPKELMIYAKHFITSKLMVCKRPHRYNLTDA